MSATPGATATADVYQAALFRLWEVVTGTQPALDDDFFDRTEASSLQVVELLCLVEEMFDREVEIGDFIADPTVRGLAALLSTTTSTSSRSTLVTLRHAAEPTHVLIAMHHVRGVLGSYVDLARAAPASWRVLGIQSGVEAPRTLDVMARGYAELLVERSVGPYALVGYSFGAFVAHAVARCCLELGSAPALLVLVDPPPIAPPAVIGDADAWRRVLGELFGVDGRVDGVDGVGEWEAARRVASLARDAGAGAWFSSLPEDDSVAQLVVTKRNLQAAATHSPQRVDCPTLLVTAGERLEELASWSALAPDLHAYAVNADHLGVLTGERATEVATIIERHVETADR